MMIRIAGVNCMIILLSFISVTWAFTLYFIQMWLLLLDLIARLLWLRNGALKCLQSTWCLKIESCTDWVLIKILTISSFIKLYLAFSLGGFSHHLWLKIINRLVLLLHMTQSLGFIMLNWSETFTIIATFLFRMILRLESLSVLLRRFIWNLLFSRTHSSTILT